MCPLCLRLSDVIGSCSAVTQRPALGQRMSGRGFVIGLECLEEVLVVAALPMAVVPSAAKGGASLSLIP